MRKINKDKYDSNNHLESTQAKKNLAFIHSVSAFNKGLETVHTKKFLGTFPQGK